MMTLVQNGGKWVKRGIAVFTTPASVLAAFGQQLSYDEVMRGLYVFEDSSDQKKILNGIAQKQRDFWNDIETVEYYRNTHWNLPGMKEHSQKTLRSLNLQDKQKIVDLGCGWGRVAQELLKKKINLDYIGIDFSDNMLKQARKELIEHSKGRIDFINHDLTQGIPLKENSADKILANWGIVYFPQHILEKTLTEVYRALKPGGIFVCGAIVKNANFVMLALKTILTHPIESVKKRKIIKKGVKFGEKVKKLFPLYTKEQLSLMISEAGGLETVDQYSTLSGRSITIVARKPS